MGAKAKSKKSPKNANCFPLPFRIETGEDGMHWDIFCADKNMPKLATVWEHKGKSKRDKVVAELLAKGPECAMALARLGAVIENSPFAFMFQDELAAAMPAIKSVIDAMKAAGAK